MPAYAQFPRDWHDLNAWHRWYWRQVGLAKRARTLPNFLPLTVAQAEQLFHFSIDRQRMRAFYRDIRHNRC